MSHDNNDAKPYVTSHKTATELGRHPDRDKRQFDPLLDRKSERTPLLDDLMDEALRSIMLTADGATTSLEVDLIFANGYWSRPPVSSLEGEIRALSDEYRSARTQRARLRTIKAAQDFCKGLRYAPLHERGQR